MVEDRTRRRTLKAIGLAGLTGLAGCMDSVGSDTESKTTATTTATSKTTAASETSTAGNETADTTEEDSEDRPADGNAIADFEDLSAWTVENGDLTASSDDPYAGSQSGVLERGNGEPVIERPVELSAKKANLSLAVNIDADEHAVLDVKLINEDSDNHLQFAESIRSSASGFWQRLDLGATGVEGLPNLKNITKVRIRMKGGGTGGKIRMDDLREVESPDDGYVAVVFDDAQRSDYTKGFDILEKYDIQASSAIVTNHVDDDGFLTLDQMKEMQSAGWDFASHTASHSNLLNASRLEVEREVVDSKQWLESNGFERASNCFVYPYGLYDKQLKSFVDQHYDAAFGFFSPRNAASGHVQDSMTVSRGDGKHIESSKSMVDLAHLYNDLSIITFHGIDRSGNFDVTSDQFEEFASYLSNSDAKPITLSEVTKRFVNTE